MTFLQTRRCGSNGCARVNKNCRYLNRPRVGRRLLSACLLVGVSLVFFSYYIAHFHFPSVVKISEKGFYICRTHGPKIRLKYGEKITSSLFHSPKGHLRLDAKVLVFVETQFSHLGKQISDILEALRIKFKLEVFAKSLPALTNSDKGKFALIIFENIYTYFDMDQWNRELLDKYCKEYNIGMIGFFSPQERRPSRMEIPDFPLVAESNLILSDYHVNKDSPLLRLTKAGEVLHEELPDAGWTAFHSNHSTYEPAAMARQIYPRPFLGNNFAIQVTVLLDKGSYDGIRRVFFGNGFNVWLHKLLFVDSLALLSHGKLFRLSLERYILVDIDDIFVGEKNTRMKPSDVQALLNAQSRIKNVVPGFRFNLGFSGKFYHKGTAEENVGDDMLIQNAEEFWWFCHMWSHSQPHLFKNISSLETEMKLNREFAKKHKIPLNSGYSVAPHHSGVYPVHEPLYEAWKRVWGIRVTSTEEYPHLRPARLRRGFIHRNVMVLPRQTCGLYTHTIFFSKYPGGREKLESSIKGGDLFTLFVFNPVNVFMTHLSNYGNDRLALYAFETVISFVQRWTNIQLRTLPPVQLAEKYFQTFPEESDPLWMNPCNDKRHRSIWSVSKSCDQLPKFLVIGPQKTGTTTLYSYLAMHPTITSNYPSPETFDEVQFFNGRNYHKGLDWYMSFFPVPTNSTDKYLFEKSATYFDGESVPMRAHALLPSAKLVTILTSPIKRAYSWYQHMRSHKDQAALNFTFHEVITSTEKSQWQLRELKSRCLWPGMYAQHIERWLTYYPSHQLLIIDGEELKSDAVSVMSKLQLFLRIKPFLDYEKYLRNDSQIGSHYQPECKGKAKCLKKNKNRSYPPMDIQSEKLLKEFYLPHNVALSKLLTKLNHPIPSWLQKDLAHS